MVTVLPPFTTTWLLPISLTDTAPMGFRSRLLVLTTVALPMVTPALARPTAPGTPAATAAPAAVPSPSTTVMLLPPRIATPPLPLTCWWLTVTFTGSSAPGSTRMLSSAAPADVTLTVVMPLMRLAVVALDEVTSNTPEAVPTPPWVAGLWPPALPWVLRSMVWTLLITTPAGITSVPVPYWSLMMNVLLA